MIVTGKTVHRSLLAVLNFEVNQQAAEVQRFRPFVSTTPTSRLECKINSKLEDELTEGMEMSGHNPASSENSC